MSEFVKTSISIPSEIMEWVKQRSREEDNLPVSRVIAQVVREKIRRESKSKTKGGVRK